MPRLRWLSTLDDEPQGDNDDDDERPALAVGSLESSVAVNPERLKVDLTQLGVTTVRDRFTAKKVVAKLMQLSDRVHACDTEVAGGWAAATGDALISGWVMAAMVEECAE
jgi:hypothetical protein